MMIKKRFKKVIKFIKKNEFFIVSIIAIVVIGISAFSFGLVKGAELSKAPVKILTNNSNDIICKQVESFKNNATTSNNIKKANCKYVGSVHGKKFYPPTCPSTKRINPKNLTCFESEKNALERGYTRTKSCKY